MRAGTDIVGPAGVADRVIAADVRAHPGTGAGLAYWGRGEGEGWLRSLCLHWRVWKGDRWGEAG